MFFNFFYPHILFKIYDGKWIGKGRRIITDSSGKITAQKITNITEIKKIDDFTFFIKITFDNNLGNINLLAFINKETGILESTNPIGNTSNGINQIYFNDIYLIHSSSTNTSNGLETTTIKLKPYKKPCPPKPCSKSKSCSKSCSKPKHCSSKCH